MGRERTFAQAEPATTSGTGSGRPLDPGTRAQMERGFGHDFRDVRVHTGARSGQAAGDLGARAFTRGRDVHFAPGAYAPRTPAGRRLLAHELAHVVQQQHGSASARPTVGQAGDPFEREAEAAGNTVAAGGTVRLAARGATPTIQRAMGERDMDHPVFARLRLGPVRAGNVAETPIVRRYIELFGGQDVYFGAVRRGGLAMASFFGRTEADRQQIARYLGSGTRPDILDTRSKEVYDVKSRADTSAPAALARYMQRLEDLYVAYNPVGRTDHPFQVAQESYLDARYRLGNRFPNMEHWFMSGVGLRVAQQAPGIIGYVFLLDDMLLGPNTGEQLETQNRAALAELPAMLRPPRLLVTLSPRAVEFDPPANMAPGSTIRVRPTAETRGIVPGLEFREASLTLGPDRVPTGGSLKAVARIPFARDRSSEFTFAIDANRHAQVQLSTTLQLGALGEAELQARMENDLLTARATLTPRPSFLRNARGEILYREGELSGGILFTPDALSLPIPGLTVSNVSGGLTFTRDGITGEGGLTLNYRGLGQAQVTVSYGRGGLGVGGTLSVTIPGLQPVTGTVSYGGGHLTAETRLTKEHFPAGLPLESGAITIRLVDGQIEGSGNVGVRLGPVGRGTMTFGYTGGNVSLGAGIQLEVPGLRGGTVTITYANGRLEGEGSIPINSDRLPGIGGNLVVRYHEGRFGAETQVSYQRGELNGSVTIRLDQLEDGSLAISGGGEVSARVTPWLTGRVQVEVTRDAVVNVQGEIRAPNEIELFPRWEMRRERTFPRIDIPLFGFSVPVVGSVGIVAFIEGGAGFVVFAGPAVLRNIGIQGQFSLGGSATGPGAGGGPPATTAPGGALAPCFDISGTLSMAAGAEAYLFVGGGISLSAAVADISGSIRLRGSLGAVATLGVTPHIGYANGDYYFRGDAELQALAYLRFSGAARAAIDVILYGEVWSREWPLFDWVYPLGLNVGLRGRMEYIFGRPFNPRFEFQTEDLDPMAVVRGAIPGASGNPAAGPSAASAPRTSLRTDVVPGSRAGGAGIASTPPTGGRPPGAPPPRPVPTPPTPAPRSTPTRPVPARPPATPMTQPPGQRPPGVPPPLPTRPPGVPPPVPTRPPSPPAPATPQVSGPRPPGVPPPVPTRPAQPVTPTSTQPPGQRPPGVPPPIPQRPPGVPPPIPQRPPGVPPPVPTRPPATPATTTPPTPPGRTPPTPGQPGQAPPPPPPAPPGGLGSLIRRFAVPSGSVPVQEQQALGIAQGGRSRIGAPFEMQVDFDPAYVHLMPEIEYQQFVAGRFRRMRQGSTVLVEVDHYLPGNVKMNLATPHRDGAGGKFYGDRRNTSGGGPNDDYFDQGGRGNRTHGTRYRGHDNPGIRIDNDDHMVEMDLRFEGRVVHTPTGQILRSQTWETFDLHVVT